MAGVSLNARLEGRRRVERTLAKARERTDDLRPVWAALDRRLTDRHEEQFDSGGRLTGGWKPLSPEYAARKAELATREVSAGGLSIINRIMQRSGRLKKTMVNPFEPAAVHRVRRMSFERGTTLPYALAHHEGRGRLPKREVLVWTREDRRWLVREIQDRVFD